MLLRTACALALSAACASASSTLDVPEAGGPGAKADRGGLGLTFTAPLSPRRGPVELTFAVTGGAIDASSLRLELETTEGWAAATTFGRVHATDDGLSVTWDSFQDVDVDVDASLRLASDRGALPFAVALRNAPETDRIVAVSHPLVEANAGGAAGRGHDVALLSWGGAQARITGTSRRMSVGGGPRRVRASPDGRFLAVLNGSDGTVSLLRTPLGGPAAAASTELAARLPGVAPVDLVWSPDGRRLLVAAMGDMVDSASLWSVDVPADDGPFQWMEQVATLPGPPLRLDADRAGRTLVFCGSGGRGLDKLVLLDAAGNELSRVEADMSTPNTLVFAPDGRRAVMTSTFYGDEVRLIDTTGSLAFVGAPLTSLVSPFGFIVHPSGSGAGLLSQLDKNRATSLTISSQGLRAGTTVAGLSLAGDLAMVERGRSAGTVLATGVSGSDGVLHVVRLGGSGTASVPQEAVRLGTGAENIPDGVAVQR
ncbi:MAG: Lactonase, 7-bladed beta-propeller [Pseudomonadota bacterium]|jgi:hypothetical protein